MFEGSREGAWPPLRCTPTARKASGVDETHENLVEKGAHCVRGLQSVTTAENAEDDVVSCFFFSSCIERPMIIISAVNVPKS